MTVNHRSLPLSSQLFAKQIKQGLALLLTCLIASPGFAQENSTTKSIVTVPVGTRIPLVLTHPIQSKRLHRGDNIYAQVTAPVIVGNQVLLPAGTFVQGQIDKLERKNSRGELHLQSMSLTLPTGYVANLTGQVDIVSDEGYVQLDPGKGRVAGALAAPLAGAGIGALIGTAARTKNTMTLGGQTITSSSLKGVAIGSVVGMAAGGAVSLFLLTRTKGFYLDAGSPAEMVLQNPLPLEQDRVTDAVKQSALTGIAIQPIAPRPLPPLPPSSPNCIPGMPPTIGCP